MPPTDNVRSTLTAASAHLREVNTPHLAAAVEAVLAPGGWKLLRDSDIGSGKGPKKSIVVPLPKGIRDRVHELVAADPLVPSVTDAVDAGYLEFLEGTFVPLSAPVRLAGPGEEMVALNVRPDNALRDRVAATGAAPSAVAGHYLMFRYKIGLYAPGAVQPERTVRGAQRNPEIPVRVRDAIRAQAKDFEARVNEVVNEGLQKFLDGQFTPTVPVWSEADRQNMTVLSMYPDTDLYQRVQEVWKAEQQQAEDRWRGLTPEEQERERAAGRGRPVRLSPTAGWPGVGVRASQVAIAYLLDEFGIEADPSDG